MHTDARHATVAFVSNMYKGMNTMMRMLFALTAVIAVLTPAATGARVAPTTSSTATLEGGVTTDGNPIKPVTSAAAVVGAAGAVTADGELDAEVCGKLDATA